MLNGSQINAYGTSDNNYNNRKQSCFCYQVEIITINTQKEIIWKSSFSWLVQKARDTSKVFKSLLRQKKHLHCCSLQHLFQSAPPPQLWHIRQQRSALQSWRAAQTAQSRLGYQCWGPDSVVFEADAVWETFHHTIAAGCSPRSCSESEEESDPSACVQHRETSASSLHRTWCKCSGFSDDRIFCTMNAFSQRQCALYVNLFKCCSTHYGYFRVKHAETGQGKTWKSQCCDTTVSFSGSRLDFLFFICVCEYMCKCKTEKF